MRSKDGLVSSYEYTVSSIPCRYVCATRDTRHDSKSGGGAHNGAAGRVALALFLRFTRSQVSQRWEGSIGYLNGERTSLLLCTVAKRVRLAVELASNIVLNNEREKRM